MREACKLQGAGAGRAEAAREVAYSLAVFAFGLSACSLRFDDNSPLRKRNPIFIIYITLGSQCIDDPAEL